MAALTQARVRIEEKIKTVALPMAAVHVYKSGIACWDPTNAVVTKPTGTATNLVKIGEFDQEYDNSGGSSGGANVLVNLDVERTLRWYDNDPGGGALVAANLGTQVYMLDDHTVTSTSANKSLAGRLWKLDTFKGAGVESMGFGATGLT